MITRVIFTCCVICTGIVSAAQNTNIPSELKQFVTPGYTVLDFGKQDLNGDRRSDYVLILKKEGEDTISFDNPDWEAKRPIFIITRDASQQLKVAAANDELVYCKNCGGVMGDPYQGLSVKPNGFTISMYGGSSWRWSEDYTFMYDPQLQNWFMQTHQSKSFHAGNPEKTMQSATVTRTEAGDITLAKFSPQYSTDSSSWVVTAPRTYFYNSPQLGIKPRKAYLVKGNSFQSIKAFKHFIYCSYGNGLAYSEGYILKKDLRKVGAR